MFWVDCQQPGHVQFRISYAVGLEKMIEVMVKTQNHVFCV